LFLITANLKLFYAVQESVVNELLKAIGIEAENYLKHFEISPLEDVKIQVIIPALLNSTKILAVDSVTLPFIGPTVIVKDKSISF
jgi:hypothetical protein